MDHTTKHFGSHLLTFNNYNHVVKHFKRKCVGILIQPYCNVKHRKFNFLIQNITIFVQQELIHVTKKSTCQSHCQPKFEGVGLYTK
jgi:hypothetical protein